MNYNCKTVNKRFPSGFVSVSDNTGDSRNRYLVPLPDIHMNGLKSILRINDLRNCAGWFVDLYTRHAHSVKQIFKTVYMPDDKRLTHSIQGFLVFPNIVRIHICAVFLLIFMFP